MPKKIWLSWSSGKDSAYALHVLRSDPTIEVVALLTTVTEGFERVSMHGVRRELLEAQALAVGLPLVVCEIPSPCNDEEYRRRMGSVMRRAASEGIEAVAFGDLFLEDIRLYREQQLAQVGLAAVFPLWGANTAMLAEQMLDAGLRAVVTCVDPRRAPRRLAGRIYDRELLRELPPSADPCAENGELHTFAFAGPMFAAPIPITVGEVVERDGFVFADVLPWGCG
jgi:uncharacterized protein (TIGR00290 family)